MFPPLVELIECQSLYNVLNEGIEFAKISDPYYLYLLDCRPKADYCESHILLAKNIKLMDENSPNVFKLPYEAELQSRNLIVVYDSNSSTLDEPGRALECARQLAENGSKNTVRVLRGGYEAFSKHYPFLRSQKILFMPRVNKSEQAFLFGVALSERIAEMKRTNRVCSLVHLCVKELDDLKTYPSEIVPGLLYLGNYRHATQKYIQKDLKIKSYIDCTKSSETFAYKNEKSLEYFNVPVDDAPGESICNYIDQACDFIDINIKLDRNPCLVFSNLGISRSAAIIIAYIVKSQEITVEDAFAFVSNCKKIQPQAAFLSQISQHFAAKQNSKSA